MRRGFLFVLFLLKWITILLASWKVDSQQLAIWLCAVMAPAFSLVRANSPDQYCIGVGIADITGPAAEVNIMGYANMEQTSNGIHMRTYARAFVFADDINSRNRFVFVSADMGMISQLIKLDVLKMLSSFYGDLYTARNVILSATHTHSATAGFFQYFLYEITSFGFVRESHEQFVRGIVEAIRKAHANMKPAYLFLNTGQLMNTQINRSPTAYLQNPQSERALYPADTDFNMHLVRIDDVKGHPFGMINWYPVHSVSMNNSNRLISSDSKGYASQMFERTFEPNSLAGLNDFVAAFAQSFEGDVSPNTAGPRCIDTGLPCDLESSTCNGKPTNCIAFGPGKDMFDSTKIIGENQLRKAIELFSAITSEDGIRGNIGVVHRYVDMSNYTVNLANGQKVSTCIPALGYAFAAGTTDGPGMFAFQQGTESGHPFWDSLRNVFKTPTPDMIKCHSPKPILIATGLMDWPYPWQPTIIDVQMAKIGQLVIVPVPGEFTTMAGRRLISAVTQVFADAGQRIQVVIAGLSNIYGHYITTPEEYSRQRYEGASNMFGPNSLPAYIQLYKELAQSLVNGTKVDEGPQPPYLKDKQWSILPPVVYDGPGSRRFGDILQKPLSSYTQGDTVRVSFVGAHPRNSMGTDLKAFMTVDKLAHKDDEQTGFITKTVHALLDFVKAECPLGDSFWKTMFTDAEWETRFQWERESSMLGTSRVALEWTIPLDQEPGTYRICYFGHSKKFLSVTEPISGCSPNFVVKNKI